MKDSHKQKSNTSLVFFVLLFFKFLSQTPKSRNVVAVAVGSSLF